MGIGVRSTKTIETVCKEYECITDFEASLILPIEGGHIKTRLCMTFDNTKALYNLMVKELCVGFVSTKVPAINYLKYDMSFFDDTSVDTSTTTKFRYYM